MSALPTTTIRLAYRFRLRPTPEQVVDFERCAGARRWVWNYALGRRREHYTTTGTTLSCATLSKELTALKKQPETAWLSLLPAQMLQQPLRDLEAAFGAFFARRARLPRFKSKKRDPKRFRFPQSVRVERGAVVLPKIGRVRMIESQRVEGEVKSATVRERAGHWYVSIAVEQEVTDLSHLPLDERKAVGLDLGLRSLATLSTGDETGALRPLREALVALRRVSRRFSRTKRGSRRRARLKAKLTRLHARVAAVRQDCVHKLTTELARVFDIVCVEDLCVQGLVPKWRGRPRHSAPELHVTVSRHAAPQSFGACLCIPSRISATICSVLSFSA